jgi:hypothetical protein
VNADLVPVVDATDIERAADPAEFVVQTLERAKSWLATALDHGDIDRIVELKATGEAIRVYVMSKQLGKDAELSAAEIVRRAERGIGLAVRRGQDAGVIRRKARHGVHDMNSMSPLDVLGVGQQITDTYALADDITAEMFEAALSDARTDRNMSRANLVRRVRAKRDAQSAKEAAAAPAGGAWESAWEGQPARSTEPDLWVPDPRDNTAAAIAQRRHLIAHYAANAYTSWQIAEVTGLTRKVVRTRAKELGIELTADNALGTRTRKGIDSNRIVRETASTLDGIAMGVGLVDVEDLDPAEIDDWVRSLSTSIRALNRLIKQMKERTQ